MDYSDETPERYWVMQPRRHGIQEEKCSGCGTELNLDGAIPVLTDTGPLCKQCALTHVHDIHPLTVTYLEWIETNDVRWWSAWLCNEDCCMNVI